MVASVIMLIGLLGLAGLQIIGMRANNLGKRMSQASLLGQALAQNMQIWAYTDPRLQPHNFTLQTDPNTAAIAKFWDLTGAQTPTARDGTTLQFDYSDGPAASYVRGGGENALAANYEGVKSPFDPTLPIGEQTIFTRYWNVIPLDLTTPAAGSAQGMLVQIVVRWKEPNFGYRSVTHSFFKYDPTQFNQ